MGVSDPQLSMSTVINLPAATATQATMSDRLTVKLMASISSSLLENQENQRGGCVDGAAVDGGCSTRAVSSAFIAASAVCASTATASVDVLAASRRVPGPRGLDLDDASLLWGWLDARTTTRCRACNRVNRKANAGVSTDIDVDTECNGGGIKGLWVAERVPRAWQLRCHDFDRHAPTPPPRWWCGGAGCMLMEDLVCL